MNPEYDIDLAMSRASLAGMRGADGLKRELESIAEEMGIVTPPRPTALSISQDLQELTVSYLSGAIEDAQRNARLKEIIINGLNATDEPAREELGERLGQ